MFHLALLGLAVAWERHAGVNCYAGHGATELGVSTNLSSTSLADCQDSCQDAPGCTGLVYSVLNLTWVRHSGLNCYDGHGARELTLPSASSPDECDAMTIVECQNQCVLTPGCALLSLDHTINL